MNSLLSPAAALIRPPGYVNADGLGSGSEQEFGAHSAIDNDALGSHPRAVTPTRAALDALQRHTAAAYWRVDEMVAAMVQPRRTRWKRKRRQRHGGSGDGLAGGPHPAEELSASSWALFRDEEGQVRTIIALLQAVLAGGVQRQLRADVWPLLLGCLSPEDGFDVQEQKLAQAEAEFEQLWKLAQFQPAARESFKSKGSSEDWDTTLRRVLTDSGRTGRDGPLFQGESRDWTVRRLERILLAYALWDPETGYCQGMADIAAPFLHVYSKDYQAFWAFRAMMTSLRANFQEGMDAIHQQMQQLRELIALVDPPLYKHLRRLGAQELSVAFQMLLMAFRRELPWDDTLLFWEALWAGERLAETPLKVYAATALFEAHRRRLLRMESFDELVAFVNAIPSPPNPLELALDAYQLWRYVHTEQPATCGCAGFGKPSRAAQQLAKQA